MTNLDELEARKARAGIAYGKATRALEEARTSVRVTAAAKYGDIANELEEHFRAHVDDDGGAYWPQGEVLAALDFFAVKYGAGLLA